MLEHLHFHTRIYSNFSPIELKTIAVFLNSKVFLLPYLDKIIVKFLSNAISIGIFLSRDIVVLSNMRASKLHCSAILPKNIACVNQPLSNHNMQIKIGLFLGSVPTKIGVPCNFYFIKFSPRQTVEAAENKQISGWLSFHNSGLYYKHVMIVNDACSGINK